MLYLKANIINGFKHFLWWTCRSGHHIIHLITLPSCGKIWIPQVFILALFHKRVPMFLVNKVLCLAQSIQWYLQVYTEREKTNQEREHTGVSRSFLKSSENRMRISLTNARITFTEAIQDDPCFDTLWRKELDFLTATSNANKNNINKIPTTILR